ncbi:cbb3-type cytochrome oxidase assembly protein CcoS [Paracoccus rhizosphaerae]|uniref:Cbb3-type cytochrome oxidase assembly protein CcoS n=1 Tax=Paracoccus rhizosphaerae TaxID=1133347 RepID=A0ABV6CKY2_9RHOB|nr:cbb3-type cytochrome oxidase assembly protein CcoS [Paracoccus rhizosphaerae]
MSILSLLIPVTLVMGLVGLASFFWSLRNGQYEDLEGDAERILYDEDDRPLPSRTYKSPKEPTP